jgi:hypothetical protein
MSNQVDGPGSPRHEAAPRTEQVGHRSVRLTGGSNGFASARRLTVAIADIGRGR